MPEPFGQVSNRGPPTPSVPGNGFRPPLHLRGDRVALVPLDPKHSESLVKVAGEPEIWRYFRGGNLEDRPAMDRYIQEMLRRQEAGTDLPFTILGLPEERPVGMTRFMEIDRENRGVEIGGTWLARPLWGTGINPEAKYLMLRYAFEEEGVIRVQIKSDARNLHSQRAIEALGAVREGVLRHQVILPDGFRRDSIYYSILAEEWPGVKRRLEQRLSLQDPRRPSTPGP
jgi:RimJ/RimL family protein N-acetyltransferase